MRQGWGQTRKLWRHDFPGPFQERHDVTSVWIRPNDPRNVVYQGSEPIYYNSVDQTSKSCTTPENRALSPRVILKNNPRMEIYYNSGWKYYNPDMKSLKSCTTPENRALSPRVILKNNPRNEKYYNPGQLYYNPDKNTIILLKVSQPWQIPRVDTSPEFWIMSWTGDPHSHSV